MKINKKKLSFILLTIIGFLMCINLGEFNAADTDYVNSFMMYKYDFTTNGDDVTTWVTNFGDENGYQSDLLASDAELNPGDYIVLGVVTKFQGTTPQGEANTVYVKYNTDLFEPVEDYETEVYAVPDMRTQQDGGVFPNTAKRTHRWKWLDGYGSSSDPGIISIGVMSPDANNLYQYDNTLDQPFAFIVFKVKDTASPGTEATFEFENDPANGHESILSNVEGKEFKPTYINKTIKIKEVEIPKSEDTTLSQLSVTNLDGSLTFKLDPEFIGSTSTNINTDQIKEYTVIVPASVDSVIINATLNDPKSNLSTISNPIVLGAKGSTKEVSFSVTPEPGSPASIANYKITIKRLDDSSKLETLALSGITGFTFNKDTTEYNLTVPFKTASTTISASLPTSSKAEIKTALGTWSLTNNGATINTKTIRVEAEDCKYNTTDVPGNICSFTEYKINIIRTAPDTDSSLTSLSVKTSSTGTEYVLSPSFASNIKSYTVTVPFETTNVYIDASATSSLVETTTGVGNVSINGNTTVHNIVVTAEDKTTTTYTVTINKEISNNAFLTGITVNGSPVTGFNKNTESYTLDNINGNVSSLNIGYTKENQYSNVVVSGQNTLKDGNNTITLTVTAQDNTTTKTYTLNVYRKSNNANLQSLNVTSNPQGTLNPSTFNPNTTTYTYTYDEAIDKITINGTVAENNATITSGSGDYIPSETVTNAKIVVTAEDGTTKTYTVNFVRKKSNDANLRSLTVTDGGVTFSFDQEFSPSITTYNVTVPYEHSNVTIEAEASSPNVKSISGRGTIPLGFTKVTRTVTVTAEDGTTKTYTLNITREKSGNNYLTDLKVNGVTIADFDKTKNTYTLSDVKSTVNSLNITYTKENNDATVTITPTNGVLTTGNNTIIVRVTAQNGDVNEYELYVKKLSGDAKLTSLTATGTLTGNLTPTFNADTYTYTYKYDRNETSVNVNASVNSSSNATIEGLRSYNPQNETQATIIVTAEDTDITKTYTINFEQILENDATLNTLTVTNDGTTYNLTPSFNSSTFTYNVTVPSDVSKVTINGTPNGNYTKQIEGLGETSLDSGSNTKIVKVTAEDGTTKTYTLNIERQINTNATLIDLKVNGTTIDGFSPNKSNYILDTVSYDINEITITATGTNGATISGDLNTQALEVGDNTFEINVLAEDGITTGKYTIKIRRKSNDSTLSNLTSSSGTVAKTSDKEYTITIPSGITNISLTPTLNHNNANIINSDTLTNIDITNLEELNIEIEAEDTQEKYRSTYKIILNKQKDTTAFLSDLTVSEGVLTPNFIKTNNNYTVEVESDVSSITISATKEKETSTISGDTGTQNLDYDLNTFTVTVTAEDGTTTNSYTIAVTRKRKNILSLSDLTIDGTTIENFLEDQTDYEVTVKRDKTTIEINAVAKDAPDATISGMGIGVHTLTKDSEVFTFLVTAHNGETRTYKITVNKEALKEVNLTSLEIIDHTLTPSFNSSTTSYTINDITNETTSLTINAIANEPGATITYAINNESPTENNVINIPSDSDSGTIKVTVTLDGSTKEYTLNYTKSSTGLDKITSAKKDDNITDIHIIDGSLIKVANSITPENTTYLVSTFIKEFINPSEELKLYQKDGSTLSTDTYITTSMVLKLERGSNILDTKKLIILGDANGDGEITIADAVAVANRVGEILVLEEAAEIAANANQDDDVTIADAVKIANFVGEITTLEWK